MRFAIFTIMIILGLIAKMLAELLSFQIEDYSPNSIGWTAVIMIGISGTFLFHDYVARKK